jgi:DNA-binding MarR family transcriptional regulator
VPVPEPSGPPLVADQELVEAWQLLMGVVLSQRWRWPEVSAELGISQAGLRALLAIDPDDPRPMRDLARAMNCDASYVTAMIDDLEHAGYAERCPSPTDRRIKIIALTGAGIAALRTAQDVLLTPPAQLSRLDVSQQRILARVLRQALAGSAADEGGHDPR